MEIRWLGHSTFEIRSSTGTVVVDHRGELPKTAQLEDENTVFAFSQGDHFVHTTGQHQTLTGPGEYEIGGLSIRGVATPADDPAISKDTNTVYIVDADGMHVATLGNPGHQPSAQSVQQINKVDILIINPEAQGLEPDELSTVIRNIEPKMIVSSGYDTDAGKPGPATLRLLTELGVKEIEPTTRLNVSRSGLPDERKVVVLQQRTAQNAL